jgi:NADH dehydrogenase FAD-containing subunit
VKEANIQDKDIFGSIPEALSRYPSESYELVIGTATSSDLKSKTVTVTPSDSDETRTIPYDYLVLATGSRTADSGPNLMPWKGNDGYEELTKLLHETQEKVQQAKHIIVAGAGATGVEVAGELGFEYATAKGEKKKEIVLLNADQEILRGDSIASAARSELKKVGVEIRDNSRVTDVKTTADGQTEVVLANGEVLVTDLYLPTMGLIPNTEYLDKSYLNENGFVVVNDNYEVHGAEGVWAVGDLVGKPRCGFMITQKQAAGVGRNVDAVLGGKEQSVVKGMPFDILVCAVGRSRTAGRMGVVKMLSVMGWAAKGRTLGMQMLGGYINGSVA